MKPTCLTLFSGLGGGALGFQRAGFELVGGFDSWDAACRDYEYLTGSKAHCVDLGALMPEELRELSGERRPDVVFTSPPCKAFSGCLPRAKAKTKKYVELSSLAERGVFVALEAWDEPPPVFLLENVPNILSSGRKWLDAVVSMLRSYGYAVTESTHDCGVLGGLAQKRRRFLLIARHMEQVPEFVYEPPRQMLRSVGDLFEQLPVPIPKRRKGDPIQPGGAMHALQGLSDLNWLRLALIPPGGDWRDLPEAVRVKARAARQNGGYGVEDWNGPAHAVLASASVKDTRSSVVDPRVTCKRREGSEGVTAWGAPSTTVIANGTHHNGPWQIADPRITCSPWATVYGVQDRLQAAGTIIGHASHDTGRFSIPDDAAEATHYVIDHEGELYVLGDLDLEAERKHGCRVIRSHHSDAWHRPMTVLELAALQGLPVKVDGEWLKLDGNAKKEWKQRIGNAVPPPTAQAIAETIKRSLEASQRGQFLMGAEPVWVEEAIC